MGRILVASGTACIAIVHPLNSAGKFENESADSPFLIAASDLDEFGYTDDIARKPAFVSDLESRATESTG